MDRQDPGALWPPTIGDYVRVRSSGVLGEIVETPEYDTGGLYTLNVFSPAAHDALTYRLEDLESAWPSHSARWGVHVARVSAEHAS
jgi:hypothetical protein